MWFFFMFVVVLLALVGSSATESSEIKRDKSSSHELVIPVPTDSKVSQLLLNDNHGDNDATVVDQEQVDLLVRTFKRLPEQEQARIGINLEVPIAPNSDTALKLMEAWKTRQKEFKQAVESMVVPVDHMKSICDVLRNTSATPLQVIDSLKELESVLTDVDNARDFHTIGGWPLLARHLVQPQLSDDVVAWTSQEILEKRMYAAWSIGTAVKNNYDYQLWTLEEIERDVNNIGKKVTVIELLLECLAEPITANADELHKKAMYAMASATRGNADVQAKLMNVKALSEGSKDITFVHVLSSLLHHNQTSLDVLRKVWSFMADMLVERKFIREDLANSQELSNAAKQELATLELLGDTFCSPSHVEMTVLLIYSYTYLSTFAPHMKSIVDVENLTPSSIGSHVLSTFKSILSDSVAVLKDQVDQCPESFFAKLAELSSTNLKQQQLTLQRMEQALDVFLRQQLRPLDKDDEFTMFEETVSNAQNAMKSLREYASLYLA